MNDLRIVWLLPTAWFYWQPSLSELSKLFPNTKVFSGLFPGFAKGFENSIDIEVVGDRKVIAVTQSKTSYGDNFTYLSPKIVPRLLQYNPDVIFSSSFGVWSILAILFKFIGRWKVVIAYEGSSPSIDYRNSAFRLALRRLMVHFADACITNSHAGKEYLIEILNAPEEKVFVQPYEVPDVRSLTEVNKKLLYVTAESKIKFSDLNHPVFLFVGGIIPRKGVRCLIEACKKLKDEGNKSFSVLLVGDGRQRSELQTLSCRYNLDDYIIWVGRVNYDDIGTYFYHADVFVLPTLEDTWGMVVLEAMLLGKPILCSRGAGASELVIEGKNGYCFKPDDSKELATAMQKLIKNLEKIEVMGECSKQIMSQYTPQAAAEMMSKVITHVTGS
ncbi:MAG: glycosyltransferase family 4 protein [Pleurocapsa sp. MO_226.B13]|nr:glycosyltransferase family 4 protein [Pleurocapsa sp. MO_226.B13]